MSDRQTTALVLLVILAGAFYLYRNGNLSTVAAAFTGTPAAAKTASPTGTSASLNYSQLVSAIDAPTVSTGSGSGNNTSDPWNIGSDVSQAAQIYAQMSGF